MFFYSRAGVLIAEKEPHPVAAGVSSNEATQVPHPLSGLRPPGGFVRFSRAPKKRAFGDFIALFLGALPNQMHR